MDSLFGGFTSLDFPEENQDEDSMYDFQFTDEIKDVIVPPSRGGGGSVRPPTSRLGSPSSRNNFSLDRRPPTIQSSMKFPTSRPWTSVGDGDAISVASTTMSGLISSRDGKSFNPLNMSGVGNNRPTVKRSPSTIAKDMENQISGLLDKTTLLKKEKKYADALEQAKEAVRKEQLLKKHKKKNSLSNEDLDRALKFAVGFNLASAYEANDMLDDAMKAYEVLVKQRKHPLAGRVSINLANIKYKQHDYVSAIEMYKIALDHENDKSAANKIRRNIGNAFFHLGRIKYAVTNYEKVMDTAPDFQTGFNLLVCHLSLEDLESVKKDFLRLVGIPCKSGISMTEEEEDEALNVLSNSGTKTEATNVASKDDLKQEISTRMREADRLLLTAARLIAPALNPSNLASGYEWVCNALKDLHEELSIQIELEQAIHQLKNKEFGIAAKMLKSLANKDGKVKSAAATNLSFLSFLEGDIEAASDYADTALEADPYNAKALVNKGNCCFINRDYWTAKGFYEDANSVQSDCAQSIFNLGLTNAMLKLPEDAIDAFERLHKITPNNPSVLYQIADTYDLQGQHEKAVEWFNVLSARVPSDSAILTRIASLYSKEKDESQAFHYLLESYRHFPFDLDVIERIGAWFVQKEMFEQSIRPFQHGALIQPKEIQWGLMVASAHKKIGAHNSAFHVYEKLHTDFPENIDCLRNLIETCKVTERAYFQYAEKLKALKK